MFGLLLSVVGGKCTTCVGDKAAKARVAISAGVFFILSGSLCLVTVSLPANTIIKDFYNPLVPDAQRRELGACLYMGWGASGLLLIGGALLCCQCPSGGDRYNGAKYSGPKSTTPGKEFQASSQQQQPGRAPANIKRRPKLSLLSLNHQRVIK
ncbi:hypothetical protein FQN60_000659, partial [Etheostoma spectabile]